MAGQKRPEPGQAFPAVEWQEFRLQGQEWLAERASKKLKNDGLLITSMAGTVLRFEIDQVPLWRGNHVGVKQLVDDFAKYLYLPRVKNAQVILDAIQDGVGRFTWSQDTFAYADYYDATADRYRGLEAGRRPTVQLTANSVVVKPEVAARQIEAATTPAPPPPPPPPGPGREAVTAANSSSASGSEADATPLPRFRQDRRHSPLPRRGPDRRRWCSTWRSAGRQGDYHGGDRSRHPVGSPGQRSPDGDRELPYAEV